MIDVAELSGLTRKEWSASLQAHGMTVERIAAWLQWWPVRCEQCGREQAAWLAERDGRCGWCK